MILKTLGSALLAAGLLASATLAQAETVRWTRMCSTPEPTLY